MLTILKKSKEFILIVMVFFLIYLSNLPYDYSKDLSNGLYRRLIPANDVIPNTYLPFVLVREGTIVFDSIFPTLVNFDDAEHKKNPYFLVPVEMGYVSAYPIVTGILAVPIYYLPLVLDKIPELTYHENILRVALLGRVAAAFYTALSIGFMYEAFKIYIRRTYSTQWASEVSRRPLVWKTLVFVAFFALGTSSLSVSSRGLWLHTTSQFLFSIIIFLLVYMEVHLNDLGRRSQFLSAILGLLLGLSVVNRLTNIVFAVGIAFYFYNKYAKLIWAFAVGVLPTVLFLLGYNYVLFGSPVTEGYSARDAANVWEGSWAESIPAFFVSPARGFLFLSPPLLLGFLAMVKSRYSKLLLTLSLCYIVSLLLMGKWYAWAGAPAFGARMLADFLPFLAFLSYTVYVRLPKKYAYIVGFLMIYSIYVHTNAIIYRKSRCGLDHNWTFYCLQIPAKELQY